MITFTIWALSGLFGGIFSLAMGIFALTLNSKSKLHQMLFYECMLVTYYAIIEWEVNNSQNYETAYFWLKVGILWPFIFPILLVFILFFTKNNRYLEKTALKLVLILPAIGLSIIDLFTDEINGVYLSETNEWIIDYTPSSLKYVSIFWMSIFLFICCYLTWKFSYNTDNKLKKIQANFILVGIFTSGSLFFLLGELSDEFGIIVMFPTVIYYLVLLFFLLIAIFRYELLMISPLEASNQIFDTMDNWLFLVDINSNIIAINKAVTTALMYSTNELVGRSFLAILHVENSSSKEVFQKIANLFNPQYDTIPEKTTEISYEIILQSKTAICIPILLTITPFITNRNKLLGYICVGTNLSLIKKLEVELQVHEELAEIQRKFVINVSHELRTPITVLYESIVNFRDYKAHLTIQQQELLVDMMYRNITFLSTMIEDLLILSRIDDQKMQLVWQFYSPADIICEILFQLSPLFGAKHCICTTELIKDVQLWGDPFRIAQVIRILVDNAVKYSSSNPKIHIRVGRKTSEQTSFFPTDGVVIQVIDYGIGIPPNDLPHLFQRFYRSTNTVNIQGSGLGLAIASEIVTLHHGTITVVSELNKGSTFSLFLPFLNPTQA